MKKYKAYLTMEITADVQEENEDKARDLLAKQIEFSEVRGIKNAGIYYVKNIKVKRYWGGGNEILDDGTVVVR